MYVCVPPYLSIPMKVSSLQPKSLSAKYNKERNGSKLVEFLQVSWKLVARWRQETYCEKGTTRNGGGQNPCESSRPWKSFSWTLHVPRCWIQSAMSYELRLHQFSTSKECLVCYSEYMNWWSLWRRCCSSFACFVKTTWQHSMPINVCRFFLFCFVVVFFLSWGSCFII